MVDAAIRRTPTAATTEWLNVLPPATRFAFYGSTDARAAALPAWGVAFSEEACRANAHATRATLWLGPDEYLLLDFTQIPSAARLSPGDTPHRAPLSGTLDDLERALTGVPHALVDISHRQFALEVSGPHATTILSGACPLDLDLAEFPVGMCTRTVLAKADVVLWRKTPAVFHLEVLRSFAGYVGGILAEIGAEFHPKP